MNYGILILSGEFGKMIDLKSCNILVTGGLGFIGSHLVEELVKINPARIVCIKRSNDPKNYFSYKKLSEKVILADCDIKNFKRVFDIITKYEIDVIFHVGAQPIVQTAYINPLETIETNIMGTANILEACRLKGNLKAIVVASSDKAYGTCEKLPYNENTPLKGNHPYDASKSSADLLAQTYFKTYNLPVTISRFCNIFGPGDFNFNRIVPGIFKAIINKEKLMIRSDGKMKREYVFVKDVVDGYLKLAVHIDKTKGLAFNFGTDNIFSVLEVLEKIENILDIKIDYEILNIAKNEIPAQFLDWSRAKELLNWKPETSFENAIKTSFVWYKEYLQK